MTLTKAKQLLPRVKEDFIKIFPTAKTIVDDTPIVLLTNYNRKEKREKIIQECGASFKEDGDIKGEAIFGKKGKAVLVYPAVSQTDRDFYHTCWHELGHIFTRVIDKELFDIGEQDIKEDRDTKLRSGITLWSEFIAEYIAIIIENEPPLPIAWPKQDILTQLIKDSTLGDQLNPYPLAFYCAIMMGDNTIDEMLERVPDADIGLDDCDEFLSKMIVELLRILDKQLCKENYWSVSKEKLEEIGAKVDEIWTHCYYSVPLQLLAKRIKKQT